MQPVPGGLCRNILSCSGKRVSSCLNSKKSLIRLTSLPLATPAMTIGNITVPLVPIHSPADNALVALSHLQLASESYVLQAYLCLSEAQNW